MQVNRLNFSQIYPRLLSALRESLFVSFDLEFTGLYSNPMLRNTALDTANHRYMKTRESVCSFCPLQIGLCFFRQADGYIEAKPFSFSLYPVSVGDLDRVYCFQSSSLQFLIANGYDFNTTYREGLGFLNRSEYARLQTAESQKSLSASYLMQGVTHDMRAYHALCQSAVQKWKGEGDLVIDAKFMKREAILYAIREMERITEVVCEEVKGEDGFTASVKVTKGKRPQPEQLLRGFSEVIEQLKGKPLLGHNLMIDTMHLYDKFIDPLPPSLSLFSAAFHKEFPTVFDTKYMLQSSSVLKNFEHFTEMQKKKYAFTGKEEVKVAEGFEGTHQVHDAGFDALCTGTLFARSCQLLRVQDFNKVFTDPLLDMFRNRIAVAGRKIPIKLDAEVTAESREDVYVLEKSAVLPNDTLKAELEKKFGKVALYKVYWSDTLMYLIPSSIESRDNFLKAVTQPTSLEVSGSIVSLRPYADFSKTPS